MEADNDLNARLDSLANVTERVRAELERENIKRDKRIRTNRMAMIVLSVVACLGVGVGFSSRQDAHAARHEARVAQHELHIANAQTQASRKASCQQYNDQQDKFVVGDRQHALTLVKHLAPPPRDAKTQGLVDDYLRDDNKTSVQTHKHRDCTPAGIAAYLNLTTTKGH